MDGNEWSPAVRPGAWAAVDTGLLRHRKMAGLRGPAVVLYLACVLHCAEELTDGRVREHAVRRLLLEARARRSDFAQLVDAGLLELDPDGDGWTVGSYLEWNPPRQWWDKKRAQGRERQQRYREANARHKADGQTTRNASPGETSNALRNAGDVTKELQGVSRPLAARARPPHGGPCPDCGEKPGYGHLETCPRMPRTVDAELERSDSGEGAGTAPTHVASSGSSRTPEALESLLRSLR